MQTENARAFKEWGLACAALRNGEQILLIRKGGIREEQGVFVVNDREFWLFPTFEHQQARLLKPEYVPRLEAQQAVPHNPHEVRIDAYAMVETIVTARNDEQVAAASAEHIWNETYVKERFDYNPYDPLYLLILRVYLLPEALPLPLRSEYGGCRSWISLERPLSTAGVTPAIAEEAFQERKNRLLTALGK